MKSIENIESFENKRVILRLDLNVPIKNGKITDSNRIDKVIPTLEFLLKKKAKIIIISHVGRPKGKIVKELSLDLVSLYIKNKIKKEVPLLKENIFNLQQLPKVNGGIVVMDPFTGRVLALSGGFSFKQSEFNRATQAKRQPGSAFKPFVYALALENNFTPTSLVLDAPLVLDQGDDLKMWKPEN